MPPVAQSGTQRESRTRRCVVGDAEVPCLVVSAISDAVADPATNATTQADDARSAGAVPSIREAWRRTRRRRDRDAAAPTARPATARHGRPRPRPEPRPAQKRQRVAPCGSAVATPNTVCAVSRKRCHGGGPALGALYGAVNASPSTCTGQPPSR
jgi:hypothetical protein